MDFVEKLSARDFLGVIDHTFLKTEKEGCPIFDQEEAVLKLCQEAHSFCAYSVCVREDRVSLAKRILRDLNSSVKIVSVIGFPRGDEYSSEEKCDRLFAAKTDGADEFDMVMNYQALKMHDLDDVYEDVFQVSLAADDRVLKVIFEMCFLSLREKEEAGQLILKAFSDSCGSQYPNLMPRFFKTSTGLASPPAGVSVGATIDDVKMLYSLGENRVGIKPAGGVGNLEDAKNFFKAAGAPMLGGVPDPMKFRIGSSSLLANLVGKENFISGPQNLY